MKKGGLISLPFLLLSVAEKEEDILYPKSVQDVIIL